MSDFNSDANLQHLVLHYQIYFIILKKFPRNPLVKGDTGHVNFSLNRRQKNTLFRLIVI